MADDLDRVVPLDELDDFRVADGDPDVRGWDVIASDGRKVGEVDELLVDTAAMKVRYLDVDLDDEVLAGGENRHVLIPIGYARLDETEDRIFVDELDSARLAALPVYDHQPLTRDYEGSLRTNLDASYSHDTRITSAGTDFYAHDHYDEVRFYGTRRPGLPSATPGGTVAASGMTDETLPDR